MIKSQTNFYDSSTLKASTYEFQTKKLYVEFNNATYLYKDVSVIDYNFFAGDISQGKAINTYIKNKYEFEKLEATDDVFDEINFNKTLLHIFKIE